MLALMREKFAARFKKKIESIFDVKEPKMKTFDLGACSISMGYAAHLKEEFSGMELYKN